MGCKGNGTYRLWHLYVVEHAVDGMQSGAASTCRTAKQPEFARVNCQYLLHPVSQDPLAALSADSGKHLSVRAELQNAVHSCQYHL